MLILQNDGQTTSSKTLRNVYLLLSIYREVTTSYATTPPSEEVSSNQIIGRT